MVKKGLKDIIKLDLDVVKLVRIEKEPPKGPERKEKEILKINPRVTPEEAVKALRNMKGGPEIIEMLKKEGKKL